MPLRDHNSPPFDHKRILQALHGMMPASIVRVLNPQLPANYRMEPEVHLGNIYEIDVGAFERDDLEPSARSGVATLPQPTMQLTIDEPPDYASYETRIYDQFHTLVAAIEIVSAANKDRPETRAAFASKCSRLWNNKVCVSILDFVPTSFNLYCDALDLLGHEDPKFNAKDNPQYACTFRARNGLPKRGWRLESWAYPMNVGERLPSLPIWLNDDLAIMLDLEDLYELILNELRLG